MALPGILSAVNANLHGIDWGIIVGYVLAMMGLGAYLSTRIRGFKDYFLAGGMLTTPILICTLVSTYYELDVTFGTSESAYYYGVVAWTWLNRPYYIAIILAAILLAGRLKKMGGLMTLPDLLEKHYGLPTRIVGAAACFIYSLPITALAGMTVMFTLLGWDPVVALALSVGVCVVYTVMGGLWADAISDTVQFVLMCVSMAVAIPVALNWVGGWEFTQHLPVDDVTGVRQHLTATGGLRPGIIIAWTIGALTVFVEPAFYQRIFAARDHRSIIRALLVGIVLWASYDWGVTMIGLIARSAAEQGLLDGDLEGKHALVAVCLQTLPLGLKGLFIGGVLAAAMSSVDSYSLLASGNVVYDIARPLWPRPLSDRALVIATRIGIFGVMLVAVAASLAFDRITDAWVFMSGALASVVFVPVMGAIWLKPRRAAGLLSASLGLLTFIVFHVLVRFNGSYDDEYESWSWTVGGVQLWREYAAIAALPMSCLGFALGQMVGRK